MVVSSRKPANCANVRGNVRGRPLRALTRLALPSEAERVLTRRHYHPGRLQHRQAVRRFCSDAWPTDPSPGIGTRPAWLPTRPADGALERSHHTGRATGHSLDGVD